MELYCLNDRCFLHGVKTLTNDKTCKSCGKVMFLAFEKEMADRELFVYPNEFYDQFHKWKTVKPKVSRAFLEESVILFHYHILFTGRYFLMRYMQSGNRISEANELINTSLINGSLENWLNWLSHCYNNQLSLFQQEWLPFLSYLFDKKAYPKYWFDLEGEQDREDVAFGQVMIYAQRHILANKKIISQHVLKLIIWLNGFFDVARLFEKYRFYQLNSDKDWLAFKHEFNAESSDFELAFQINSGQLTMAQLNDSNTFSVMQPIHFSPFSFHIRPWLYIGKEKGKASGGASSKIQNDDDALDPRIKKKMKEVSASTFSKLASASRKCALHESESSTIDRNEFVIPERYKRLGIFDAFDTEKNQFLCDLLDILNDQLSSKIYLKELFSKFEQKTICYDWKSAFFSALRTGGIIWYNALIDDDLIVVELNPSYVLNG